MEAFGGWSFFLASSGAMLLLLLLVIVWRVFVRDYCFRPLLLEARLRRQGFAGPPRTFLAGNLGEMMRMRVEAESRSMPKISHDIVEYVQPHIVSWGKTYGFPFVTWWAYEPRIVITDLDLIKEVLYNKSNVFWRSALQQKFLMDVIGRGLVVVNGEEWAFRRHVMTPAFYQEKIKGMVATMASCVSDMVKKWDETLSENDDGCAVEVEVSEPITKLTADIISRTAFGSSFLKGHKVFELVQKLGSLVVQRFSKPWMESFIPTSKLNRDIRSTQRQLHSTLLEIIEARREQKLSGRTSDFGNDLLALLLEEVDENRSYSSEKKKLAFTNESLMEECKTFYVAGHETTAKLITWAMMLLATNPDWQERARSEVVEVCKSGLPDSEALSKMKIVGMILNEALRLYPPAVFLVRNAFADVRLGSIEVPAGVGVLVPIISLLHAKEVWGDDADEFNPQRFAEGVSNASKHPFAFLPFSHGPRVCLGQGFALAEAKVSLAMILLNFSFEISPKYRHSPVQRLTLVPKHGLPLLLRKINK